MRRVRRMRDGRNMRRTLAGLCAMGALAQSVDAAARDMPTPFGRLRTNGGDPNDPRRLEHSEYARDWSPFGFGGRYAWPSGHTSSTISVAAALSAYYDDEPWVPFVTYPVALAIGIGMIDGDRHWASDV